MSQPEITLETIKPGREGWVYLVHAEETDRYKIGRSVNPVARHQVLQGQSPYPLKIVKCFWTIDAVTDETYLHKFAAEHRVYGEWFEFTGESLTSARYSILIAFDVGHVISGLAESAFKNFFQQIGWDEKEAYNSFPQLSMLVLDLYYSITDKSLLTLTDQFMRQQLLQITRNFAKELTADELSSLLVGAIAGFAAAHGRILQ